MLVGPTAVALGDLVCGNVVASYGGYMTAVLDTWRVVKPDDWIALAPVPLPDPRTEIDTNFWTVDSMPELGGSGFYYTGEARLTCVRLSPPPVDPHVFHRDRRAAAEAAKKEAEAQGTPVQDHQDRPRSKRREDRAKSCRRYVAFRQENNEPTDTVGQDAIESRGRPKSRARGRFLGCPILGQKSFCLGNFVVAWGKRNLDKGRIINDN